MKKIYKNPELKVVKIQTARMIAVSGLNSALGTTEKSGNQALGRQGGFIDDEDEE